MTKTYIGLLEKRDLKVPRSLIILSNKGYKDLPNPYIQATQIESFSQ